MTFKYTLEDNALIAERTEIPTFWEGDVVVAGARPVGKKLANFRRKKLA